jgi:hypothetical protein
MGSVELVWDEERQEQLARKRILGALGDSRVRFKREFRAIAAIHHENLVRLHELDEDGLGPYFTMEYVRGDPLLDHCDDSARSKEAFAKTEIMSADPAEAAKGGTPTLISGDATPVVVRRSGWRCNWERIERLVPQIVHALDHLHANGVVHCDLKPSNAMVSGEGVVKLLDFGVVAEMRGRHGPGNELVAGTPAYMAPERLLGATAAPSIDLYALGVMLFEMISGTLPFDSVSSLLAMQQARTAPPRLDTFVPDAPARYVELCAALLHRDPALRAKSREVLDVFGHATRSLAPTPARGEEMVGRSVLQAALRGRAEVAGRGAFECASLQGQSGSGKTALASWLARELEGSGWLVLRGRASTSEHVAFNALDGAIDDLAGALSHQGRRRLTTALADSLRDAATLFPVLRDLVDDTTTSKTGTRARGFEATTSVLRRVAAESPVLLVVDDLQWADADSIALLDALVTAAPARVLLVMTTRDDVGETHAIPWLRARAIESLHVGPLDDESVYEVIQRAARSGGVRASKETILRVASAAAGRPFLAEALGRALAHDADAAGDPLGGVAAAIGRAPPDARALLAFSLAAGGWTPIATLAQVMDKKAGEVVNLASDLESAGLVRRDASGGKLGAVDVYHDQVRERALALLDPRELASAHDRFVAWFADRRGVTPSVIVRHLVGAGRIEEAAALACEAARVAEDQRAFGLASAMYEVALRVPSSSRVAILRKRALALEMVGGYAAAAACWNEIAVTVVDLDERNEAILHEAHALLGGNEIARGYARLNEALVARGQPSLGSSKIGDLWSGLRFVVSAFSSSGPDASAPAASPEVEARVRREMTVGQFVAYFDPLAGLDMMRRSRASAARLRAYDATAFCDYTFAYFSLFGTRKAGRVPLYERFRARAERFSAGRALTGENAAWPMFLDGVSALREGEWERAATQLDAACESLQREGQVGTQSIMYTLFARLEVELWRQNGFGHARAYERVRAAVEESHTGTMHCQIQISAALIRLWAGDPDGATAIVAELQRSWPREVRTVQQLIISMSLMLSLTLRGDSREAREVAARLVKGETGFSPLDTIYATWFTNAAALAEVSALRGGDPRASAARVRKYARVSSEGPPLGRGSERALAYLEEHLGHPEAAMARFEAAEREALRLGQPIDAALARFARAKRLGGDTGAAMIVSARALLAEAGVSERVLVMSEFP